MGRVRAAAGVEMDATSKPTAAVPIGVPPSEGHRTDRPAHVVQQQRAQRLEREVKLDGSEWQFRYFVEAVRDYAIFKLDPEGRVASWNVGAERIKGYKASEIIGRHFSCFYREKDAQSGKPQRLLALAARQGRVEDEGWRVRNDGSLFWADVVITSLRDDTGVLQGFLKVTKDTTELKRTFEALKQSNEELRKEISDREEIERQLHELSGRLIRTQDEVRRRIARDLHDSTGQDLIAALMILTAAERSPEQSPEARQSLEETAGLLRKSLSEIRTLTYLLHPPLLEEVGLGAGLRCYVDGFSKRSGIDVEVEVPSDLPRLSSEVETTLYRVAQESLVNIQKHSGSRIARVRAAAADSCVVLEVQDEGQGLPLSVPGSDLGGKGAALGVGILGMQERMRQLGGSLEVTSGPLGTTVRATLPVRTEAAAQLPPSPPSLPR